VACLVHNVVALRNRGCYRSERMFTFYAQDQQRLEMLKAGLENAQSKALWQDLRCVLKAGIPGIPMWPTEEDLEHEYKLHVVGLKNQGHFQCRSLALAVGAQITSACHVGRNTVGGLTNQGTQSPVCHGCARTNECT